ncbi:hypothetical protein MBLNU230_g6602t1 [Neophaeotheca triangularis]
MAKAKAAQQNQKSKQQGKKMFNGQAKPKERPEQLYATAVEFVEQSQPEEALKQATKLWNAVKDGSVTEALPAINLMGEINVELGEIDDARLCFEKAVTLDPEGKVPEAMGGGAEKFLWLAQLCDEGGQRSVDWYEKGVVALQHEIAALESGEVKGMDEESLLMMRVEKKRKLANALCGIVEVYMTDLSWEDDAETRCENLVTQAMSVEDETSPEVLQTLASVRLSQERKEDAQAALKRSIDTWKDLDPEDDAVPDFPIRISLSRLLMEAEMEYDAMSVLARLIQEDDQSVEAWYLGGWCQHLIADRHQGETENWREDPERRETIETALRGSRQWMKMSLKLFEAQDYEDDRLKAHAEEVLTDLNNLLGPEQEGEDVVGAEELVDDEEWEGIDDDEEDGEDEKMKDA